MERAGMQVLPRHDFQHFSDAIDFVLAHPARYVFKPSGVIADNKELVIVGEDPRGRDILEFLRSNKNRLRYVIRRFQLQEFAEGVEIAVGAFFNGKRFLHPINVNFECKRMFPGDIGPLTSDMGVFMFWSKRNRLYEATLARMEGQLRDADYRGYFDINCIVGRRGIFPLEFTSRFGYPTIDAQLAGLMMPYGDFFYRLACGEEFSLKVKKGFQIGVCGVLPAYFTHDKEDTAHYRNMVVPLTLPVERASDLYFKDIKRIGQSVRVAGEAKYIAVAVGTGATIQEAQRRAYANMRKIRLNNLIYRNDIGQRWFKERPMLNAWKYLQYSSP